MFFKPVTQLVLAVGRLDRGQLRRSRDPLRGLVLELDERLQRRLVEVPGGQGRKLLPHLRYPLLQGGGGAHRRGGGIVELMGKPGRERPEREQPLALRDGALPGRETLEQPGEQVLGHREPLLHDVAQHGRVHLEERGRLGHPHRRVVDLRHEVAEICRPGADVRTVEGCAVDLDLVVTDPAGHHEGAVE